jgi:hypothetical protein
MANRMRAMASPGNASTVSEQELFHKIEDILGNELREVDVLCPGEIYKSGKDAGAPVIAGLFCLELREQLGGGSETERLKHLQEQFEMISSAVEEVRETAGHLHVYINWPLLSMSIIRHV